MLDEQRAAIAAITTAICSHKTIGSVYTYSQSKYISFSGSASNDNVSIFDHSRGIHITGSGTSLYDYGTSKHITLQINGNQFSGYDYKSGKHFSGTVSGSSVSIYDYETGRHSNYSA